MTYYKYQLIVNQGLDAGRITGGDHAGTGLAVERSPAVRHVTAAGPRAGATTMDERVTTMTEAIRELEQKRAAADGRGASGCEEVS